MQPMKPVSYDAFELAAAEALKDELRANYQKRAARERSMAAQAADALDAAQTLDQIEAALPLADAAGLPADAPEVLAAIARRDRARATEERNAVLEEINKAADCHVESCDVELLAGLLDEARSLGVDASTIVQKGRELAAVQGRASSQHHHVVVELPRGGRGRDREDGRQHACRQSAPAHGTRSTWIDIRWKSICMASKM